MNKTDDIKETNLLRLAVKCRLISTEKEKEILSVFLKEKEQTSDISIVQILQDNHYLSQEELNFLFAVKKHLKMKMLDKRFGELGVANNFVKPGKVQEALKRQNEIFKTTQQSILIGDILLEQNEITKANKSAILLTQDRIEDEFLIEALNDIASTEMERINVNMRFGAIAVKKGFISLDQLNQALKLQKDEEARGKEKPYLGKLLQDHFGLSEQDLKTVLRIQKELEKQRLALEKALSLYNAETQINKRLNQMLSYRFARSKLVAFISVKAQIDPDITVSDFKGWLDTVGITHGICSEKEIREFLSSADTGTEIEIAHGTIPVPGTDGTVELFFPSNPRKSQKDAEPVFVKKGDILAKTFPPTKGTPGMDVCGFQLTPVEGRSASLSCGSGVLRQKHLFLADVNGTPALVKGRTLFVTPTEVSCPTRQLSGNVSGNLGSKYANNNLVIDGDIESGTTVQCHEIKVNGDVRGRIQATGKVQILGNVDYLSRDAQAENEISSDEEIIINKNIKNADIVTSRRLTAPNADLISSRVHSYGEVILKNVYTDGGAASVIRVGRNPFLKAGAIDQAIEQKKQDLKDLLLEDELEEIEAWFAGKLQMQNTYLGQQTILQRLLELPPETVYATQADVLKDAENLLEKINTETGGIDQNTFDADAAARFIADLLTETAEMPVDEQQARLKEMMEIKYGMYKASVVATRRHKNEYNARRELVQKKIDGASEKIKKIQQEIDDLFVKKDYLKLSEQKTPSLENPAIRVKNQVEQGTEIQTRHSQMTVEQTMYGVKFIEKQKGDGTSPQIAIDGFYE